MKALLDSNVLVGIVARAHEHHAPSLALLTERSATFAIAAHSYAEAFNTLTKWGKRNPYLATPDEAWMALESVQGVTTLVGLTPPQVLATVRSYALSGGMGARLYDKLIGQAAVENNIPNLITWNVGHMRALFPSLAIFTPNEFIAAA